MEEAEGRERAESEGLIMSTVKMLMKHKTA